MKSKFRATPSDIAFFRTCARRGVISDVAVEALAEVLAAMRHATVILGPGYSPLEAVAAALTPEYVQNWCEQRYP